MAEPQGNHSNARFPLLWWPVYLLVLVIGLGVVYRPTILSGLNEIQTDPCDTVLNHYFLEHSWRWLTEPDYEGTFWSPPFYHPTPYTLTYSENLIGTAPIYWGARVFCEDWLAWQVWVLTVAALNFLAMLIVLRWFQVHPLLAMTGAYVFAFGLTRHSQIGHHHLLPQLFGPFIVWYFWSLIREPSRRAFAGLLVSLAGQLLASIHLGWFTCLGLGVWFVMILPFDRKTIHRLWDFAWSHKGFVVATTGIWAAGLGMFFRNYFIGNKDVRRDYNEALFFMPWPIDWLACPPGAAWGLIPPLGAQEWAHERNLCMGIAFSVMLLGCLVMAWRARQNPDPGGTNLLILSTLLTLPLILFIVSRIYDRVSVWYLFYHGVPGANSIRAIGRATFAMLLLGTIGGMVGLQQFLTSRIPVVSRTRLYALILLAAMIDQFTVARDSFDHRDFYPEAAALARQVEKADAILVIDSDARGNPDQESVFAMWVGRYARIPVINGYSGREPAGFAAFKEDPLPMLQPYLGPQWKGTVQILDRADPAWRRFVTIIRSGEAAP